MSTMNKLLADIVLASGGTVRNKYNRNMLLEDWLNALGGAPSAAQFNWQGQYIWSGGQQQQQQTQAAQHNLQNQFTW